MRMKNAWMAIKEKKELIKKNIIRFPKSWWYIRDNVLYNDKDVVPDRIAFGGVKELEEFTLNDANKSV